MYLEMLFVYQDERSKDVTFESTYCNQKQDRQYMSRKMLNIINMQEIYKNNLFFTDLRCACDFGEHVLVLSTLLLVSERA